MKRIWIVFPYADIMGEAFLEARHIRFGRKLAEAGYQVTFWTANFSHAFKKSRGRGWKKVPVCDGFNIILVPSSSYKKNISIGRLFFEMTFSNNLSRGFKRVLKPDLIITAGTGLLTAFYPVKSYVIKNDIPAIYDIMDIHMFESYMMTHYKLLSPLVWFVARIIEKREKLFYEVVKAVSGLGKNQLEIAVKKTGKDNIPSCLVYNSIYVEDFRRRMNQKLSVELPSKDDWHWCVYAGSLGPSYDIKSIIKCAEHVKKKNVKLRFIIAGAGPQKDLLIRAAKDNDRIIFLGSLSPEELPAIYAKCDIGLCPYKDFSTVDMPDKFYDYCAAGLAIVNSLQGEIKEYIQKYEMGCQYSAGSAKELYRAIMLLISSDLEQKKKNAYDVAEIFDFNNQIAPFIEMVDRII